MKQGKITEVVVVLILMILVIIGFVYVCANKFNFSDSETKENLRVKFYGSYLIFLKTNFENQYIVPECEHCLKNTYISYENSEEEGVKKEIRGVYYINSREFCNSPKVFVTSHIKEEITEEEVINSFYYKPLC